MSSTMKHIASLKPKDILPYARSSFTQEKIVGGFNNWVKGYHKKYIVTSSPKPLMDLMVYVGVGAYALMWPTEIRHLKHAEEVAKHGGEHAEGH